MSEIDDIIAAALARSSTAQGPKSLIIGGTYKVGKTVCAARWADCYVVTDPNGGEWVREQLKAQGKPLIDLATERAEANEKLKAAHKGSGLAPTISEYNFALRVFTGLAAKQPKLYKRLVVDKLDLFDTWSDAASTAYFKGTNIGKNWDNGDGTAKGFRGQSVKDELPRGGGYSHYWRYFKKLWNAAIAAADQVIFVVSVRVPELNNGVQGTFSRDDIDLTGKLKEISGGFADATGLMTRSANGENFITFATTDTGCLAGSRVPYLEGKLFKVSWKVWSCCGEEFGKDRAKFLAHCQAAHNGIEPAGCERIEVDWSKIYPDVQVGDK